MQVIIGSCLNAKGLCHLWASIDLMPSSIFLKLGLRKSKPTPIVLQLENQSIVRQDVVVEDIVVQVGSLIFPVDFVILDFDPDSEVLFILSHPFLTTRGALIDVATGRLILRAHDKVEVFMFASP